jgi:hypothetical protein
VEVIKLFDSTIRDFNVTIDQSAFYQKFKMKGGITQGKMWELQIGVKEALKCVFYR